MSAAGLQPQPEDEVQIGFVHARPSAVKLWLARHLSIDDVMAFLEWERLTEQAAA
jgi:hypothetical protein